MNSLFIVWSENYETGIQILDEQCRGLVSLINSFFFHRGDTEGDISKILVPTAEMFKSYVKINFLTVEKLMRDSNYPDMEKYENLHEEMMDNIRKMDIKYRQARDAQGFLNYLKDYWLETVQHNKKEYLGHLMEYYNTHEL